ncbi:MAG: hypothetical protein KDK07_07565 [Bauldia sp.]|nr:hypothetical protein [Bauldia sp.]
MPPEPVPPSGPRHRPDDELWSITSYFNSSDNPYRRANYTRFRKRLGTPLVAVELGHDRPFELGPGDADVLIQLRGGDPMWQKERLLNIALDALPPTCSAVAWLDCDLLFGRPDWPDLALTALRSHGLVQLFRSVHYVKEAFPGDWPRPEDTFLTRSSIPIGLEAGITPIDIFEDGNRNRYGQHPCGFAWAAPRALIERERFYDTCIVGGGDRAMIAAAFGCFDHVVTRHRMTPPHADQYHAWAERFRRAVGGTVASIDGDIFHLWLGPYEKRQQRERYGKIAPHAFDPSRDIALSENRVWRWSSAKPDLHATVRDHLAARCGVE